MAKAGRAIHPRNLERHLAITPELKRITESDALIELLIIHLTGFDGTTPEREVFNCIIKAQQLESWLNEFLLDSYWAKSKLSPHDPVLRLCQRQYLERHLTGQIDTTTIEQERWNLWQQYQELVKHRKDSTRLNKFENFSRRLREVLAPGQMSLYLRTLDGGYKTSLYGAMVDLPPASADDELPRKLWMWTDSIELLSSVETGMILLESTKEVLQQHFPDLEKNLSEDRFIELSSTLAFATKEWRDMFFQKLQDDLIIQNDPGG